MDEVELLESIYGNEWRRINDRMFSIDIISEDKIIEFQVIFLVFIKYSISYLVTTCLLCY